MAFSTRRTLHGSNMAQSPYSPVTKINQYGLLEQYYPDVELNDLGESVLAVSQEFTESESGDE